ncbi:GDP-L-fucose synthase [uncultured archaeon]|nr:GDP-L-fucose synthase [uncultured archaeon]
MRLLITGGAGFIGSNFIRSVMEKYPGYEVVNLDKLTYAGNPDNLKDVEKNKNYTFIKGDICDKETVEKASRDVNVIVNFAAETHVDRSILDAGDFVTTDVLGTFRLLEAARKYDVEKYVQISTDEVYGSIDSGSFKETDRLEPSSPYSASKAGGDMLVHSYFVTHRLPVAITRSSNNFGPYQYPEKLIPLFITNALRNKKLPLYGDGKNVRDWLYVLDNCDAIDLVMHKGKEGDVYNIGSGNETTNIDITTMILKELHKQESLIEWVPDRKGHDRRYSLDATKIKKLGWKPKHDFKAALGETIRWYVENEWWWKSLI